MKKVWLGLMTAMLAVGVGASAFAAEENRGEGTFNFGQMLPFMQEMHPNLSNQELQEMYNSCHGTNGAAPSANFQNMNMNGNMNLKMMEL